MPDFAYIAAGRLLEALTGDEPHRRDVAALAHELRVAGLAEAGATTEGEQHGA